MPKRRMDGAFLPAVLLVMIGAAWFANRPVEEGPSQAMPDFSMPGIELEIPFELPFSIVRFKRPQAPELELTRDTEGVIKEVRAALLISSARDGSDVEVALDSGTSGSSSDTLLGGS